MLEQRQIDGGFTILSGACIHCEDKIEIRVLTEQLLKYEKGELAQKAFPDLDIDSREFVISQVCSLCFEDITLQEEYDWEEKYDWDYDD